MCICVCVSCGPFCKRSGQTVTKGGQPRPLAPVKRHVLMYLFC